MLSRLNKTQFRIKTYQKNDIDMFWFVFLILLRLAAEGAQTRIKTYQKSHVSKKVGKPCISKNITNFFRGVPKTWKYQKISKNIKAWKYQKISKPESINKYDPPCRISKPYVIIWFLHVSAEGLENPMKILTSQKIVHIKNMCSDLKSSVSEAREAKP